MQTTGFKGKINVRAAVFTALCMLLGIYLCYRITVLEDSAYLLLFLIPAVGVYVWACVLLKSNAVRALALFSACVLAFLVGFFGLYAEIRSFCKTETDGGYYRIRATVIDTYDGDGYYSMLVKDASLQPLDEEGRAIGKYFDVEGKLTLYYYNSYVFKNVSVGTVIRTKADIRTDTDYKAYGSFDWYSILHGIRYSASVNDYVEIYDPVSNPFYAVNRAIRSVVDRCFSSETAPVALGLLLGDTQAMDEELLENVRYGGFAHVFAVSGLHIGFVYAIFLGIFRLLCVNERYSGALALLPVLFYAGVCGFSPSSVRASVMCLVSAVANLTGQKYDSLSSLAVACMLLWTVHPTYLFGAGFQLSVCSVLGIILIGTNLSRRIRTKNEALNKLLDAVFISFGAEIAILPLLFDRFGYASTVSLASNLIAIPVVTAVFMLSFVAVFLAIALPFLAGLLVYLPDKILLYVISVLRAIDFSPFVIEGVVFGGIFLLWMVAIFVLSDKFNSRRKQKAALSIVLALAITLNLYVANAEADYPLTVTVTSDYRGSEAVLVKTDSVALLFLGDTARVRTVNELIHGQSVDAVVFLWKNAERLYNDFAYLGCKFYANEAYQQVGAFENYGILTFEGLTVLAWSDGAAVVQFGDAFVTLTTGNGCYKNSDLTVGDCCDGSERLGFAFNPNPFVQSVYSEGTTAFYWDGYKFRTVEN